jgi:predicted ATPase/DNA-binding SARP family transcriptional activator
MAGLRLSFLGPARVEGAQGGEIILRRVKALALLAFLSVEAARSHSRASLLGLLWPEMPEADARNNLRVTLSSLRRRLEGSGCSRDPYIIGGRHHVQFNPQGDYWLDVAEFQALIGTCEGHAHANRATCSDCRERLARAVALYGGEFLAGFHLDGCAAFDEWLFVQREQHHVQMMELLGELADGCEQAGDHTQAERYARRQIQLDPLRESAQRQLMRLLYLRGQRTAALAQFDGFKTLLLEELGVEPDPETLLLAHQIRSGAPAGPMPATPQPSRDRVRVARNLPASNTPFIGRERELSQLATRLQVRSYRLISIAGLAGMGKTRLAVQVARDNQHLFRDGAFFVPLASTPSVEPLPSAIAGALELSLSRPHEPLREQLASALQDKQLLLVLDNLEHLLEETQAAETTDFLLEMLRRAPGLVLLVTSRERLNLQAEDLLRLGGLALPGPGEIPEAGRFAAIRLFCDRAYRLNKSFRLSDENLPHIVRLCRLVEGMPLAIELAATWIRDFEPEELVEAVERDLDLLATLQSDVPPRHRSIRAAFEYSWRLLSAPEQGLLCRLAVFSGGFTLDAATSVAAATPISLTRLRYKSLIRGAGGRRYEMHPLVRQYALERLAERAEATTQARERHSAFFLRFIGQQTQLLYGEEPYVGVAQMRRDLDNVRQAWNWAVENDRFADLSASGCLAGLARFYALAGMYEEGETRYAEAARRCEEALEGEAGERVQAQLLIELADFLNMRVDLDGSIRTAQKALQLASAVTEAGVEARACLLLGLAQLTRGDNHAALPLLRRGLAHARQGGLPAVEGLLLRHIGNAWRQRGNLDAEATYLAQALAVQRACGNRAEVQTVLIWLAMNHYRRAKYATAQSHLEEALALNPTVGDPSRESKIHYVLGLIDAALGRYETARTRFERVRRVSVELRDRWQEAYALAHLAAANAKLGDEEKALAQIGVARSLAREGRLGEILGEIDTIAGYIFADAKRWAEARDAFARSLAHWQKIGQQALMTEATVGLAHAAWMSGDLAQARDLVGPVAEYLTGGSLPGSKEPSRVYLSCYQILRASGDPRTGVVLQRAYDQLQTQATDLDDPDTRRTFLEKVAANRKLVRAYRRQRRAI